MHKKPIIFIAFALLFLPSYSGSQTFIQAGLSNTSIEMLTTNPTFSELKINNSGSQPLTFLLSLKGSYPNGILFDSTILAPANATIAKNITFSPTQDIGRFSFSLYLESISDKAINFSIPVSLWVKHPERYILNNFIYSVQQDKIKASITIRPDDKLQTEVEFKILDLTGESVKSAAVSQETDREATLEQTIDISDLPSGKYTITAEIKGTTLKRSAAFDIGLQRGLKQEKIVTSGLFFDEVKINVYNNGNLVENGYKIYEEIEAGRPVKLVTNSTDTIKSGNTVKYEFTIEKIRPGETVSIIYRLENGQNLLMAAAGIIILLAGALFFFLNAKKPKITKRFAKTTEGKYKIFIEVQNPKISAIKNASVRDFIQPPAKVNRFESTGYPASIRDSHMGTEVSWKLPDMKGHGAITLSYTLENTEGKAIRLSPASLTCLTSRNRRVVVRSNELVLK